MALEVGAPPIPSSLTIQTSELFEFHFALYLDRCSVQKPGHKPTSWFADFIRDHPDLHQRLLTFWDSSGYQAWDELLIVAHHTGTLLDETIDRFFDRLPGALAQPLEVPSLPTETPDVEPILRERLAALREDTELRGRYVALMREAWDVLGPVWRREGRPVVAEMARSIRIAEPTLENLRRALPGVTMLRREEFEPVLLDAIASGSILIVPLWLGADGQCIFALPGVLYLGVGVDSSGKLQRKREQAERVAARLKVLSDPTRVNIVLTLLHWRATITDLATIFELSQPTVSVHMKALREAGLVRAEKSGNQTHYTVDGPELREYVMEALRDLGVETPS